MRLTSNMILNIHYDALYFSKLGARSRASGHFFIGWLSNRKKPIRLNGVISTLYKILKILAASAVGADLGALVVKIKEGRTLKLALEKLEHPQPVIPIHCDNATAVCIANETVKPQRSRSMEMRYFLCVTKFCAQFMTCSTIQD